MTLHSITNAQKQMLVDASTGIAEIVWFGDPVGEDLDAIALLGERSIANGLLGTEAPATLLPAESDGWVGQPGVAGRRDNGYAWSPRFEFVACEVIDGHTIVSTGTDVLAGLTATTKVALGDEGVATIGVELRNEGATDFVLERMAITLAMPSDFTEVLVPEGRWVHEFHEVRVPWRVGAVEIANRRGRTSHDKPPWMFAGQSGFANQTGRVCSAHLGWSGNAAVRAEVLTDGRRVLQLGELFLGDEVRIQPGGCYTAPTVYLAWSDQGMNGVSQSFHRYLRARPEHRLAATPRPVHLNTWEAVYFDHDLDKHKLLAERAAQVGVERYVLDDGWFHGRRSDRSGLGDWWVDPEVWPDGLEPLIDHVRGLGMEFGIWVEPEMVNPDSDLFRAHPDWVLGVPGYAPVSGRHQLVLDLTRAEVWDYLFTRLDRLLSDHAISYLKWDMNRDLVQPASGERAAAHHQTASVYRLLDAVRNAHPDVEIETCSSGGGRADFGIIDRTDRIWASDSNDPLERQRIQRGLLRFFPPELIGAHVGPRRAHTSRRRHSLGFRASTAFFCHTGIEWNLLDTTDTEHLQLVEFLKLHKAHRNLLHTGTVWQLDTSDPGLQVMGVVADDLGEALLSVAQLEVSRYSTPERLRVPGLDPEARYDVSLLLIADTKLGLAQRQPRWTRDGIEAAPAAVLGGFGIQLPALDPESAVLIHLTRNQAKAPA